MTLREALDLVLNKEHMEDWIYSVRERISDEPRPEGCTNSWDHPRVTAYAEACTRLKQELDSLEGKDPNYGR